MVPLIFCIFVTCFLQTSANYDRSLIEIDTNNRTNSVTSLQTNASLISPDIKICVSHSDCHIDQNERCIHVPFLSFMVCGCGPSFVRNTSNNVCELKKGLRLVFRFNSLPFVGEYRRKTSPGFIRMKELIESSLHHVINGSRELSSCVKDVRVLSFNRPDEDPSDSSLESEVLMFITNSLYQNIKSREKSLALVFVKELAVSIHAINTSRFETSPEFDAVVTEIEGDLNPCFVDDLNYCSPDSSCTFMERENRFFCSCRERFTDISPHPRYRGEVCSLECPEDYCSNEGHCHVDKTSASLYCTCNNWNVGARCQYSGIVVFSVLGIVVLLLLLVVGCSASVFCGSRLESHSSSQFSQRSLLQPKPSLLSSSYGDEQSSARPFRITIDNLNYGESATPIIQLSPGSLVQQSSQDSGTGYTHIQPHAHPPVVHYACHSSQHSVTPLASHPLSSCLGTPVPSPRPSLSTGVQTDRREGGEKEQMVSVNLAPGNLEVSLDRARGLKVPASDRLLSEGVPNSSKKVIETKDDEKEHTSWC